MTPFAFDRAFSEQLASLDNGMSLLRSFAEAYPNLPNPWAVSSLAPSIYFPSTSIVEVGKALGKDSWTVEAHLIWKEVDGVRIECRLPVVSRPFEWEAL